MNEVEMAVFGRRKGVLGRSMAWVRWGLMPFVMVLGGGPLLAWGNQVAVEGEFQWSGVGSRQAGLMAEGSFSAKVDGNNYWLRVKSARVSNRRLNWEYTSGSDGTNVYSLERVIEASVAKTSEGSSLVGEVNAGTYPAYAIPAVRILWLAFASAEQLSEKGERNLLRMEGILPDLEGDSAAAIVEDRFRGSVLPKEVEFVVPSDEGGGERVASYRVLESEPVGRKPLPIRARFELGRLPNGGEKETLELKVTRARRLEAKGSEFWYPEIPEPVAVIDRRHADSAFGVNLLSYRITDGRWRKAGSPEVRKLAERVARGRNRKERTGNALLWLLVAGLFLLPVIVSITFKARQRPLRAD